MEDVRILKKIQNRKYDSEVKEFIDKSLQWYVEHSDELLEDYEK